MRSASRFGRAASPGREPTRFTPAIVAKWSPGLARSDARRSGPIVTRCGANGHRPYKVPDIYTQHLLPAAGEKRPIWHDRCSTNDLGGAAGDDARRMDVAALRTRYLAVSDSRCTKP